MSFLPTEPVAIQRVNGGSAWARFRVEDRRAQLAMLRELHQGGVPLSVGLAGAACAVCVIWTLDDAQGHLHLSVVGSAEAAQGWGPAPRLWAAGYLDEVKVQFELAAVAVETRGDGLMLHAALPRRFYRLPRRQALRLKRSEALSPVAHLGTPLARTEERELRVLDISTEGCALLQPAGARLLRPGATLSNVHVRLDDEVDFVGDLKVQHVTMGTAARGGARVGCAWQRLAPECREALQSWISRGRRGRGIASLSLD